MHQSATLIGATVSLLLVAVGAAFLRTLPYWHGHPSEPLRGIQTLNCVGCAYHNDRRMYPLPYCDSTIAENGASRDSAPMANTQAQLSEDFIADVWIGISHQSVTVTSLNADHSFAGTYFTPSMGVRATVAGTWRLDGEVLTLDYTEAEPKILRLPVTDLNHVEVTSADTMTLQTLPQGWAVEWNRVRFAGRVPGIEKGPSPAPPSPEALKAFTVTDLADSNPLSSWIYGLVEASNEKVFEDKIVDALKNTIPLKCGYYFAIGQFEGLWGNGGMQHVVLRDEVVQTQHLLGVAAEGYEHYKRPKTAALVRELSSKMPSWMKRIEELRRREAPEYEWRAVWAEVDSYDAIFNGLLDEEGTVYTEMLADIQQYPADYTSVSQSP